MTDPGTLYEQRRTRFAHTKEAESRRHRIFGHARLICFALLLAAGLWSELRPGNAPLIALVLLAGGFIALIIVHGRIRDAMQRATIHEQLSVDGLNRLARAWKDLPARRLTGVPADHAYAGDLDLFGRPGLTQLMGPLGTPAGAAALAGMLLEPATADVVRERQDAVRDAAPRIDFRDALAVTTRMDPVPDAVALERFLDWAEGDAFHEPAWLRIVRFALPIATVAGGALASAGLVPWSLPLVPVMAAVALTSTAPGRRARARLTKALGREDVFRAYPVLFELAGREPFESPFNRRLATSLGTGGHAAKREMRTLARLAHLAGLRSSGMLYLPVQLITLWDFHVVARVESWREEVGPHVREWIDALAAIEAVTAIAALAHDHPSWAWPQVHVDAVFNAEALGHPMIPPDRRVDNDVTIGPAGTFLLVTGSNMSGKSTLLRAVGQNAVLASAGAPVCARSLSLPPVHIRTSIHVEDSLADGVSYFMAQLRRVKSIVDAAIAAERSGDVLLYLLDEILQGTNTAERRIAATRVIRHLVDHGAIGAVTTHDLELADEPAIRDACVPVHFRESVHPGREQALTFDYRLRPGVATSTNALKLMEIVGLGSALDPSG